MRKAYQSDLSDAEWSFLEPHLSAPKATGRPKLHSTREILNAIFYIAFAAAAPGGCCRHDTTLQYYRLPYVTTNVTKIVF